MSLPDFYRGDTKTYQMTFRDVLGNAIPLYGKELRFTLKSDKDLTDQDAELTKTVVFPDDGNSTAGNGSLQLTATETDVLVPGKYYYDFQLVDTTTNPVTVTTLAAGTVKVLTDITRTTS